MVYSSELLGIILFVFQAFSTGDAILVCANCSRAAAADIGGCTNTFCGLNQKCFTEVTQIGAELFYDLGCKYETHCDAIQILGRAAGMQSKRCTACCSTPTGGCNRDLCRNITTQSYTLVPTTATTSAPTTATTSAPTTATMASTSGGCSTSSVTISDGSFENDAVGWYSFHTNGNDFTVQTGSAQDESHFISITNGGARQMFNFSRSPVREFTLSGYSRHRGPISVDNPNDYSILCDLDHTDGSETWALTSNFDTHSAQNVWQYRQLNVISTKFIKDAWCYAMFRNGNGIADFDNFKLSICPVITVNTTPTTPAPNTPASITQAPSTSSCPYHLEDGSFETGVGWIPYVKGFVRESTSSAEDGAYYITVTDGGAENLIRFNKSVVHSFTLSGYSRPRSSVTVFDAEDYSIYCDLKHPDGTHTWGLMAPFNPNGQPYSWQEATLHVSTSKQILYARCYAMFRNGSGSVDFDKFKLETCS